LATSPAPATLKREAQEERSRLSGTAYVTKFWKITHMGACEIITFTEFGGLLLYFEQKTILKYFKNFLVI